MIDAELAWARSSKVRENRNSGSPAISMTCALRGVQVAGNPLENEVCQATWQPWIIKSAGDPELPISKTRKQHSAAFEARVALVGRQVNPDHGRAVEGGV
jgi:hypothetical protein